MNKAAAAMIAVLAVTPTLAATDSLVVPQPVPVVTEVAPVIGPTLIPVDHPALVPGSIAIGVGTGAAVVMLLAPTTTLSGTVAGAAALIGGGTAVVTTTGTLVTGAGGYIAGSALVAAVALNPVAWIVGGVVIIGGVSYTVFSFLTQ